MRAACRLLFGGDVKALLAGVLVLAGSRAAIAQDVPDTTGDAGPVIATAISIAATAGSVALGAAGASVHEDARGLGDGLLVAGAASLLVTPALGHLYGEHKLLTPGTIVRAGGAAVVAASVLWFAEIESHVIGDEQQPVVVVLPVLGAVSGLAMVAGGTVFDVVTAGTATARWNREHALTPVPVVISSPSGAVAGVGVTGRF
jgi:hypothetical protein